MNEYSDRLRGNLPVQIENASSSAPMPLTMSSREIADLTGKQHQHVKRDIENLLAELSEDVTKFGHIYRDSMNRQQTEYLLDRDLTENLLLGYSPVLRRKVLARLRELEAGTAIALPPSARINEVAKVFSATARIAKLAGLKDNAAILSAALATKRATGTDPLDLVGRVHLPAPADEVMINPKTIGEQIDGRSAQAVNKDLIEFGFQTSFRDAKQALHYEPTEKGVHAGGRMMDTGKKQGGRMIQQLLWPTSIVDTLKRLISGSVS